MFSNLTMWAVLGLATAILLSEVYAMIGAVVYAKAQDGSLLRKARIGMLRYGWASIVLHEFFREDMGRQAAYKISTPCFISGAMLGALLVVHFLGIDASPMAMLGSCLATGVGFFAVAYGKSFMVAREDVRMQMQAGTWQPSA